MWPSARFIDSQLQRKCYESCFSWHRKQTTWVHSRKLLWKDLQRLFEDMWSSVTPLRFPNQYKPSATFVAFLWKQICTKYNMCDALAPCQAVTLKSRFLFFLLFASSQHFLSFALIVVWLNSFYHRRCYLTWFCYSRIWLSGQHLSSLPGQLATVFQIQHILRSLLLKLVKEEQGTIRNTRCLCAAPALPTWPDYLHLVNYLFATGQHRASPKHTCPQAWPRRPRCPTVFLL